MCEKIRRERRKNVPILKCHRVAHSHVHTSALLPSRERDRGRKNHLTAHLIAAGV